MGDKFLVYFGTNTSKESLGIYCNYFNLVAHFEEFHRMTTDDPQEPSTGEERRKREARRDRSDRRQTSRRSGNLRRQRPKEGEPVSLAGERIDKRSGDERRSGFERRMDGDRRFAEIRRRTIANRNSS